VILDLRIEQEQVIFGFSVYLWVIPYGVKNYNAVISNKLSLEAASAVSDVLKFEIWKPWGSG
jgi:hypothetical protein